MAEKKNTKSNGFWRVVKYVALVLLILIALPVLLVPLYLVVDPVSTPMLGRYLTGRPVAREWRAIDQISDRLKVSVTMSEDGQFCRHQGVDLGALRDEIKTFLAGGDARGASTITMQVARNLFLWQGRSVIRKVLEVPLAFYIDLVLPKRRIMEIYLNIAEWGPDGEFGIEAGVQRAFGVDASALSWERASLMAVTLPNPLVRDPAHPTAGLRRVASIVRARAQQYADRTSCLFDGRSPDL
ncbi:MAG: monofunctional biosynthetic peptidoglycan transglycosylase [Hyphomicrobiaceae bacterium]|nr:monofunctional biosynthetic peptidoglycan transglycosylase [Hyphomicrobiaceae bacterium]